MITFLVALILITYVPEIFAHRSIVATWLDNFVFNEDGDNGWKDIGNYCGNKGCLSDNPILQGSLNKYHGPYHSIGGDGIQPVHSLSQQFYCEYPSDVRVSYKWASCDADSTDRFTFLFDGNVKQNSPGNGVSTSLNDAILKNKCSNWRFDSKTWNSIATVSANQLFEPKWEFQMNAYDYFVIWDIQITCDGTPFPSKDPTQYPTDAPSVSPTSKPSKNPIPSPTEIPSESPSSSPSESPTNEPSNDPTPAPTANPSAKPTLAPSMSPTRSPSVAPVQTPTRGPSANPTLVPSLNPTNGPTTPNNILQIDVDSNEQQLGENEVIDAIITTKVVVNDIGSEPQRMINMENLTNNSILIVAVFGGLCICIFGCLMFLFIVKRKQKEQMKKNEAMMQTSTNRVPSSPVVEVGREGNETTINPLSIAQICEVPKEPSLDQKETLGKMKEREMSIPDQMVAMPHDTKGYIGDESKNTKPLPLNIRVISASGVDEDDDVIDIEMDKIVNLQLSTPDSPEDSQSATNFSEMYDEDRVIAIEKQTTMG